MGYIPALYIYGLYGNWRFLLAHLANHEPWDIFLTAESQVRWVPHGFSNGNPTDLENNT